MAAPHPAIVLFFLACAAPAAFAGGEGKEIYARHCAECHGEDGEGSVENDIDPLQGERSMGSLVRYIDRQMPEEEPELVTGEDARKVAAYIMDAFYGPEARARRMPPPERAFARLTNRQFQESIADLLGSFGENSEPGPRLGLTGRYFQSDGMNKKAHESFVRRDLRIDFDFGKYSPGEGISADQFSIAWNGSLLPTTTGWHEFRVTTPNGVRLYLNGEPQDGDNNRRDDSAAKRQTALIDAWVSSGPEPRMETARAFLLGGRAYAIRLDYFKYMELNGAIRLEWKPPLGEWSLVSSEHLSPRGAKHVAVVTTTFPADDASEGYERGTSVSKAWHEATTAAALEVANQVAGRVNGLSGTSDDAPDRVEKIRGFLAAFAGRAFRRPLDEALRERYVDRHFTEGVVPEEAVKRAVLHIVKSPRFLYPEVAAAKDDFTVATRLALGIWDSLPDLELLEAAGKGQLRSPEDVRGHARRMIRDPRAKAKLATFFRRWLKLDDERDLQKDHEAFPDFDPALVDDLRLSLERFVEHVVWSETSDFRELLRGEVMFVNKRIARFYGLPEPEGEGFEAVEPDPTRHSGVITHPFILTRLAHHDATSPIHRGVFLTRNILGGFLKPPPEAIAFDNHRFDSSLTMREKVTEMTRDRSCMTCHETINPLGFSLENFDAVGRFRSEEHGKPIDPRSEYVTLEGDLLEISGPRVVADLAATSPSARRGFIRQLFQSVVKQNPATYGHDTLARLDERFENSGCHIRDLFLEINVLTALHGIESPATASR
jgi:hypothetical protein